MSELLFLFQCDVFILKFLKQYQLSLYVATAIELRVLFQVFIGLLLILQYPQLLFFLAFNDKYLALGTLVL